MSDSASISSTNSPSNSLDFDSLRKEAIKTTQDASGKKWTDYNIHDPGVTIIEQFSFVLTDIAYRTNIDIEQLLFHSGKETTSKQNALFPAADVFTPGALTEVDYRILFLDRFVDTITNCWIEKVINQREGITGLFNLIVHLNPMIQQSEYDGVRRKIRSYFNQHRNLCEDLEEIIILEPEIINLDVKIDLSQDADAENTIAAILFKVESYLNPPIEFKSLADLEKQGLGLDEIYNVPSHVHGFIPSDKLRIRRNQFYLSKIEEFISTVDGVRFLKELKVVKNGSPTFGDVLSISEYKYLTMVDNSSIDNPFHGFNIIVYKGGVVNNYSRDLVIRKLNELQQRFIPNYQVQHRVPHKKLKSFMNTEIESYNSIQECFPSIYGVGVYTPAKEEGEFRQAQSDQLKAYLMLFDQIMANHLSQLSKVSELLAVDEFDVNDFKTYYVQSIGNNVQGANRLMKKSLRPKHLIEQELQDLKSDKNVGRPIDSNRLVEVELELQQKVDHVKKLSEEHLARFMEIDEKAIIEDKTFENRQIVKLALSLKKQTWGTQKKKQIPPDDVQKKLVGLISQELYKREQDSDFSQLDLEHLSYRLDDRLDRKNRILSHMLARFGERFTTDFHLMYTRQNGEGSSDEALKRLLELKSLLLSKIISVNQSRAKGTRFTPVSDEPMTKLEEKVGILLDINTYSSNDSRNPMDGLKTERLTSTQLKRIKSTNGKLEYLSPRNGVNNGKATFIINSPHFARYLFQYGLAKTNYQIVEEDEKYAVYFIPPTHEDATRLFESSSKNESEEKLSRLLSKLLETTKKNEYFRIVEHILLRPQDSSFCHFFLKNDKGDKSFKSLSIGKEEAQISAAMDTLLLACYSSNYRVEKTEEKDYHVIIHDSAGNDIVISTQKFLTKLSAEKLVKSSYQFYKKEKGNFQPFIELDNKTLFYFQLVDDTDRVLFNGSTPRDIHGHEKRISRFLELLLSSENYEVLEDKKSHLLRVRIKNDIDNELINSEDVFRTEADANRFIVKSMELFASRATKGDFKSMVRFKRLDGRPAKDYNSIISIVYPNWTARFNDQEFLHIFHDTLIKCAPAHLSLRLVGLNFNEMREFNQFFDELLSELNEVTFDNRTRISSLSDGIMRIIMDE